MRMPWANSKTRRLGPVPGRARPWESRPRTTASGQRPLVGSVAREKRDEPAPPPRPSPRARADRPFSLTLGGTASFPEQVETQVRGRQVGRAWAEGLRGGAVPGPRRCPTAPRRVLHCPAQRAGRRPPQPPASGKAWASPRGHWSSRCGPTCPRAADPGETWAQALPGRPRCPPGGPRPGRVSAPARSPGQRPGPTAAPGGQTRGRPARGTSRGSGCAAHPPGGQRPPANPWTSGRGRPGARPGRRRPRRRGAGVRPAGRPLPSRPRARGVLPLGGRRPGP